MGMLGVPSSYVAWMPSLWMPLHDVSIFAWRPSSYFDNIMFSQMLTTNAVIVMKNNQKTTNSTWTWRPTHSCCHRLVNTNIFVFPSSYHHLVIVGRSDFDFRALTTLTVDSSRPCVKPTTTLFHADRVTLRCSRCVVTLFGADRGLVTSSKTHPLASCLSDFDCDLLDCFLTTT